MMGNRRNPNLEILLLAAERLGPLCLELVFLGGCATGLLVTDRAASPVRRTIDVDVIVEVASRLAFNQLEKRLRARGFNNDLSEDAPNCRWVAGSIVLDVMPIAQSILGFGNYWYKSAFDTAKEVKLSDEITVKVVTAPHFLATKMEAFLGRGNNDYLGSQDLEDMLAVIDGRPELIGELAEAGLELQNYLANTFGNLTRNEAFIEAIPGHLPPDQFSQARGKIILERIRIITTLGE
jgi:predicted nucleotidyltransferase